MSRLTTHFFIAFIYLFTAITPLMADTIAVNTVNDVRDGDVSSITNLIATPGTDGVISLREAIEAANGSSGADVIEFNIPGAGPHKISISTSLPQIGEALTINGYSQAGAAVATTTSAATIKIELDGGLIVWDGLVINSNVSNCLIKGLAIRGFRAGITIFGAENTIEGNFIGPDVSGAVLGSNYIGMGLINPAARANTIGGTTAAARNIISGNSLAGLVIGQGASENKVFGNYIGTDPTGTTALGNSEFGVEIHESKHNRIGGLNPGEGNLISGNGIAAEGFSSAAGGIILSSVDSSFVSGNLIGTDATGTIALPNSNNSIFMRDDSEDNIPISEDITINNNVIAHTVAGDVGAGVGINMAEAIRTLVQDNAIYSNAANGIILNAGSGNKFSGNAIYDNGLMGIDLAPAGVNVNDTGDADSGPNNLQNAPVVTYAGIIQGQLIVQAAFNSLPNRSDFRIEFFSNTAADPSGNGEGETYLGFVDVDTDGAGDATSAVVFSSNAGLVSVGDYISATATSADSNTSEFSNAEQVIAGTNCFIVTNINDAGDGSLRFAMENANNQPNVDGSTPDTIKFDIPGSGPHTISVLSELPTLTDPVVIDGTTEPDAECSAWPPSLAIELSGGNNSSYFNGLNLRHGSDGSTIRGLVINSFRGWGIKIFNSDDNRIECNYIGTDVSGTQALPNLNDGIDISSSFRNIIGGPEENQRNLISGNARWGIGLLGGGEHQVLGNYIGTDVSGASALGNDDEGILIGESNDNMLGGLESGAGNIIAYNGDDGIYVASEGGVTKNNALLGNSIFNNGGLGINLEAEEDQNTGVTVNDNGDVDSGPNNYQNFPVIANAASNGSIVSITGTLHSTPYRSDYRLEFFANSVCNGDQNGLPQESDEYGEGEIFLGATYVNTDGNGDASFCVTFNTAVEPGTFITATVTSADNNTSEFAQCVNVIDFPILNSITVTTVDDILDGDTSSLENLIMEPGNDGFISLREAIAAANNNPGVDEIRFDSGLDGLPIVLNIGASDENNNLDGDLDITDCSGLTIIGNGQTNTIIDGNATERVFDQLAGDLTISDVTVQNGKTFPDDSQDGSGAGLRNLNGGNLTVLTTAFTGNQASFYGGAIFNKSAEGANTLLNTCSFSNNSADIDGGALLDQTKNGIVEIDSCLFNGNYATREGGGFKADASLGNTAYFIRNSIFSENTGISAGGGIEYDASGGTMLISNTTVSENFTNYHGGGINFNSSNCLLTIINSTVSGNRANVNGGGINHGSGGTVMNLNFVTITGNIADDDNNGTGEGGGINLRSSSVTTNIHNSIVQGNSDKSTPATNDCGNSSGSGTYNSQGGNIFGIASGCPTGSDDIETADALLGPLTNNGGFTATHALLEGSPAINFANCGTLATDQRGEPRNDGFCDAGAFELPGTPVGAHSLTLLAASNIRIQAAVTIAGNLHSNDDINIQRGAPTAFYGNIDAVDDIKIRSKNTINGDVTAGDFLENKGTINGSANGNTAVASIALPSLTAYSAGGESVTVEDNQDITLAPDSYADVEVGRNGILRFSSGEYFINELDFGTDTRFVVDVSGGEIIVNIVSDLDFGQRMVVEVDGGSSDLLTFNNLQSEQINLGREATVLGNIIAPSAKVQAKSYTNFRGSICAAEIAFSTGSIIFSHGTNQSFPKQVGAALTLIPQEFTLEQNYPNPFNPTTTIRFALPEASGVTLEIYNIAGQKVRTLVNNSMAAGVHTLQWDATNERGAKVSSGIYIYRINADNHQAMKKMILLK